MDRGVKYDEGKRRWDLMLWEELEEVVKVLEYGAKKYGINTYNIDDWDNRYFSAIMRHLLAWKRGEKIDDESGINHLAHVIVNALFMMKLEKRCENEEEL